MSWTTGTQTEALSLANINGTALANSSATGVISPAEGAAYTPANFWLPTYGASKGLLVKCHGVLSTTATPTLTIGVVTDTTLGTPPANLTSGTAGVLATTGAVTMGTVTNIPWELEVIISCVTTGSSATFLADGIFKTYDAVTTATAWHAARCSSSTANPNTTSTASSGTTSAYYIEVAALWSAASASNTIQVYAHTVLGLN
jgi:hypothetical protein